MKTLAELQAIRDRARAQVDLRRDDAGTRIVVGMATCGIAAGARPVMLQFIEEINRRALKDVTVSQTGCIGMCRLEPMVEVYTSDKEKVTYVNVKPDMVGRIVAEHIVNGSIVTEYTIGAAEGN
ncbi:MAG: (2Fe-2S) ferredoxin domain-containing protein [Oscillospiraceae bacterium]|jgi:NADP-reducing hydrogenase subunit HndB|nr:(2Fe-2S) ferredoxin domain-containing protein [Oscillospiraceae bacterium]